VKPSEYRAPPWVSHDTQDRTVRALMCVVDDLIVEREEKGLLRSTLEHVVGALALSGGVTFVLGELEELIPAAEVRLPSADKASAMDLARDALEHRRPRIREMSRGGWLAAAPLTTQDRQLGVLTLLDERADSLAPDLELLEALGKQIGTGLENARMYAELRAASTRTEIVNRIGASQASSRDL
jgi:hypothetical protein